MANQKVFPIRMDNSMYGRLQTQASRFGVSVTAYIRIAFSERLEKDEATMILLTPSKKGRR